MREVPELPELEGTSDRKVPGLLVNTFFRTSAEAFAERGYVANLVRLSDKAVRDYQHAAEAFEDWKGRPAGHFLPFFGGISRLEDCINATHRSLLHARYLSRSARELDLDPVLPPEHLRRQLKEVRDRIEHIGDHLKDGRLKFGGGPSTLRPLIDRVEIAGESMSYVDLARCVVAVDATAAKTIRHDWDLPEPDEPL